MKRKVILIILIVLIIGSFGLARGYFVSKTQVSGTGSNVSTTTAVTPYLSFTTNKCLFVEATLENFAMNGTNIRDDLDLTVNLNAGTFKNAKENYNLYLEIDTNGFIYSTTKREPELLLKITDPTGKIVTNIEGLNYVTVNGESGFDITEEQDFVTLTKNYYIETNSETNQKWNIELVLLNLDDSQNRNSGKKFDASIVIDTKERQKGKDSIYSWGGTAFLPTNIDDTIRVLNDLDIGLVYHSFPTNSFTNGDATKIITKLNEAEIDAYWLVGGPTWIDRLDIIKNDIDILATYNMNNPKNKIKGITFDIEWNLNNGLNVANIEKYANLMEEIYDYAKTNGIQVVDCISWAYDLLFDEKYQDSAQYTEAERVRSSKAFEKIILNADRTSVMNYQRYGMVDRIRNEVLVGQKYNKKIESIGEFGRFTYDNRTVTLECHKELPKDCPLEPIELARKLWKEVYDSNPYENLSYSYHFLDPIMYVVGEYDRIAFKVLLNGQEIENEKVNVVFDSGDSVQISTRGDSHLPKNKNYKIFSNNYKIKNEKRETLEDGTKLYTLEVEPTDKYAMEINVKVFDEDKNENVIPDKGVLEITNLESGIKYLRYPNEKGWTSITYALFVDNEYSVSYTDSKGAKYKIDSVISMNKELLNENKNMIIPSGFREACSANSKDCYISSKYYFSKQ